MIGSCHEITCLILLLRSIIQFQTARFPVPESEHVNCSAVAMASTPSSSQVPGSQASGAVAAATDTTEENVVHISDGEEQAAGPGKKRKQYSKVWNDFTQVC